MSMAASAGRTRRPRSGLLSPERCAPNLFRRLQSWSGGLDGAKIGLEQRLLLVTLLLVLLAQPNDLAQDLHVEAVALGFGIDVLLVLVERLDLLLDPLDALDNRSQ